MGCTEILKQQTSWLEVLLTAAYCGAKHGGLYIFHGLFEFESLALRF